MTQDKDAPLPIPPIESGDEIFEPGSTYPQQATDPQPEAKPPGTRDARAQAKNKNKGHTDTDNFRK